MEFIYLQCYKFIFWSSISLSFYLYDILYLDNIYSKIIDTSPAAGEPIACQEVKDIFRHYLCRSSF